MDYYIIMSESSQLFPGDHLPRQVSPGRTHVVNEQALLEGVSHIGGPNSVFQDSHGTANVIVGLKWVLPENKREGVEALLEDLPGKYYEDLIVLSNPFIRGKVLPGSEEAKWYSEISSAAQQNSLARISILEKWRDIVMAVREEKDDGLDKACVMMFADVCPGLKTTLRYRANILGRIPLAGLTQADRLCRDHVSAIVRDWYPDSGFDGYIRAIDLGIQGAEYAYTAQILAETACQLQTLPAVKQSEYMKARVATLFGLYLPDGFTNTAQKAVESLDSTLLEAVRIFDTLRINKLPIEVQDQLLALKRKLLGRIDQRSHNKVLEGYQSSITTIYRPLSAEGMSTFIAQRRNKSTNNTDTKPASPEVARVSGEVHCTAKQLAAENAAAAAIAQARLEAEHDAPLNDEIAELIESHRVLLEPFTFTNKKLREHGLLGANSLSYLLETKTKISMSQELAQTFTGLCILAQSCESGSFLRESIRAALDGDSKATASFARIIEQLYTRQGVEKLERSLASEVDWFTEDRLQAIIAFVRQVEDQVAKGDIVAPNYLKTFGSETLVKLRDALYHEAVPDTSVVSDSPEPPSILLEGVSIQLVESHAPHGIPLPESLRSRDVLEFDFSVFPPDANIDAIREAVSRAYEKELRDVPLDWEMAENLLFLRDTYGGKVGLSRPGDLGKDGVPYFVLDCQALNGRRVVILDHVEYGNAAYILDTKKLQDGYNCDDVIRCGSRALARLVGAMQVFHPDLDVEDRSYRHLNTVLKKLGLPQL